MKNSERNTMERQGDRYDYPVAAAALIWKGTLVALNAGNAVPGAATAALVTVGIADETLNNAGGAAGAKRITVRRGVFLLSNSTGPDEITGAHVGSPCYVADNDTVALTHATNTRPVAGTIRAVEAGGVWVEI